MTSEAFRAELDQELSKICADEYWKESAGNKGKAFEIWIFDRLNERYHDGSSNKEDYVSHSHDGGVDIVFPPSENSVHLIQAKYGDGDVSRDDVVLFFASLERILNKKLPIEEKEEHGQRYLLLKRIEQRKIKNILLAFFTTRNVSSGVIDMLNHYQESYKEKFKELEITLEIKDLVEIEKFHHDTNLNERQLTGKIELSIEDGCSFSLSSDDNERENITFVANGMELRKLFSHKKQSIFQKNIRIPLGAKGKINKGIRDTLADEDAQQSGNFYYYNNGISAICDGFAKNGNKLTIENIQIINGAQTVSALGMDRGEDERIAGNIEKVRVLVKLTRVNLHDGADSERKFGDRVIRYNNSQNILYEYDFRSNDRVQNFLKGKFENADIHYMIKRPYVSHKEKRFLNVKLVDFAKIWHTWHIKRPWETSEGKKLIESDDRYEPLFGSKSGWEEFWNTDKQQQAVIAVRAFFKIKGCLEKVKKDNAEKDKDYARIRLYEFFALLLFKEWLERQAHGNKSEKAKFYTEWRSEHSLSDDSYEEFLKVVEKVAKAHYDECVTPHNTVTRNKWGYTKQNPKPTETNPDIGQDGFKELFYEEMGWEQ